MKDYFRQIILFAIGILITVGIYIVDVVFYRVPSFIKVFRIERELAAVLAILLLFPILKKKLFRHIKTVKQKFITFPIFSVGLVVLLLSPHVLLSRYIVLWDNNPMLAEYPAVWNFYSVLTAILFALLLLLFLQIIKSLIVLPEKITMTLGYKLLLLGIIIASVFLNTIEDRYLYLPVLDGYIGLFNNYKLGIYSFVFISIVISFRGNWIDKLDRREKWVVLISGIITILLILYMFWSKFIVAVYAFSTTVKGFVLMGYLFVLIFLLVAVVKLLLHLPTAAKVDRAATELNYITQLEGFFKNQEEATYIIQKIVDFSTAVTNADVSWLELNQGNERFKIAYRSGLDSELAEAVESFTRDNIKERLLQSSDSILINNIKENPVTDNFRFLDVPWKSLLGIPVITNNEIRAILYLVKNKTNGFSSQDKITANRLLIHMKSLLPKLPPLVEKGIHIKKKKYQVDIFGSKDLIYDSVWCDGFYDSCIFGIPAKFSKEKIAEIKGSLKIVMQMSDNPQKPLKTAITVLDEKERGEKHIFLFLNTDTREVGIVKSDSMFWGISKAGTPKGKVIGTENTIFQDSIETIGVVKFNCDRSIDLTNMVEISSANKCISKGELDGNFQHLIGDSNLKKDLIIIQKIQH